MPSHLETADLPLRLDRFRHHEDEEVAAITTEAANEICRLEAALQKQTEAARKQAFYDVLSSSKTMTHSMLIEWLKAECQ